MFAEPRALIGFAGPRTIKATIRIELPKGFQTSEFLLEHGYIDRIVPRAKAQERNCPHNRLLRQIAAFRQLKQLLNRTPLPRLEPWAFFDRFQSMFQSDRRRRARPV